MKTKLTKNGRRGSAPRPSCCSPSCWFWFTRAASPASAIYHHRHHPECSSANNDHVAALKLAEGGAMIACSDLNKAFTNHAGAFLTNLLTATNASYTLQTSPSTNSASVYHVTIRLPFSNQTVTAQITMTNASSPSSALIQATATVNQTTQQVTVAVTMTFGKGAAIISVNQGDGSASVNKGDAQNGDVVVDGIGTSDYLIVNGGFGTGGLCQRHGECVHRVGRGGAWHALGDLRPVHHHFRHQLGHGQPGARLHRSGHRQHAVRVDFGRFHRGGQCHDQPFLPTCSRS